MKRKIKKAINLFVKKIEKLFKSIYHKLPISSNFKTKAKNVYFTIFGCFFKNTASYIIWKRTNVKLIKNKSRKPLSSEEFINKPFTKKIAIHLHLYYFDLLDDFVYYLSNIPYRFDLYISVIDDSNNKIINEKTNSNKNINKVVIKKVQNRGRDVAPFVVDFAKEILNYDYVCHIHSKKSLYTGKEQMGWRKYLLEGLMGSGIQINNIMYQFEKNPDVALIYPETYPGLPYWGHTWLSNENSRNILMEKLGYIDMNTETYIDFPMGTMFWARMDSIRKFFKCGLKTSDFPQESGQLDGTIAHAFERCLGVLIKIEGYTVMTYDGVEDKFYYGYGKKNLNQYFEKTINRTKELIYIYDIISFDIFDTLLMRKIDQPSDIFMIVENKIKNDELLLPFKSIRIKAEKNLRKSGKKIDYSIDDIYAEIKKITNLSTEICDKIKLIEISTEIEFIQPRKEVLEIFTYAKKELNKKIILVSDMYLPSEIMTIILNKFDINNYDELWISCEMMARKDNGSMWDILTKKYEASTILHIGDNEKSDIQLAGDRKINTFHILSAKQLSKLSRIGKKIDYNPSSLLESIIQGIIVNKYYNNPFSLNTCKFNNSIDNFYDFGFMIIGPIICDYMIWVLKKAKEESICNLLMLAREGFLFEKVFNIIKENCENVINVQGKYVYTSRRASLVSAIDSKEDIKEALNKYYEGKLFDLLRNRFGINDVTGISDRDVELPGDSYKVYELLSSKLELIFDNSRNEREKYLKYLDSVISKGRNGILDIGYSGSIQYYLSKLTGETFNGYYFATDNKRIAMNIQGNKMYGRYIENDEIQPASSSYIHRYSLLLETVLTSPDNQFCYFDDENKPVFKKDEVIRIPYKSIEEIHNGTIDFAKELFHLIGDSLLLMDSSKNMCEQLIKNVVEKDILSKEIKNKFVLEDQFCASGSINVFERLKNYKEE